MGSPEPRERARITCEPYEAAQERFVNLDLVMDPFQTRAVSARRGKPLIRAIAMLLAAWAATVACVPREAIAIDDDATSAKVPRFYGAKPGSLLKARGRIATGDKSLQRALKNLVATADEALEVVPPSVTEKEQAPPSGDRHDYMSLAPYFWPDPTKPGGRPYVRRDGERNPESRDPRANDGPRIAKMGNAIESLSLAYFFTGDEKYATHAADMARVWFIAPATRMNPNFAYAQAVPGKADGRPEGILEARHIAVAIDSLGLLVDSKELSDADRKAMVAWLREYVRWLLASPAGREEQAADNNHGTYYDVQVVRLALCLDRKDYARRILVAAKKRRIAAQIAADGSQPHELKRTKSLSYSRFNLEALCELATLGEHAGVDLWGYAGPDGAGIRRGIEFVAPYFDEPAKKWPYEQIDEVKKEDFLPILRCAALAYKAPAFEAIVEKYPAARADRFQLLFVP
jgi:hypothetical protein